MALIWSTVISGTHVSRFQSELR